MGCACTISLKRRIKTFRALINYKTTQLPILQVALQAFRQQWRQHALDERSAVRLNKIEPDIVYTTQVPFFKNILD